jgi:hypothetical protein
MIVTILELVLRHYTTVDVLLGQIETEPAGMSMKEAAETGL